ncbi:MAG: SWIM zinc finger family protein, partial [Actinobacteria bacterium]|nr:SWIM zinc finger family protein [Actinomycetota bacterium]
MKEKLADLLTLHSLVDMSVERSFACGGDYFSSGYVRSLAEYGDSVSARVLGNYVYEVRFWINENSLMYSCTCPMGDRGVFCKHCVATGLEWLDMRKSVEGRKPDKVMKEIEQYLRGCRHKELTEVIMHQALSDE